MILHDKIRVVADLNVTRFQISLCYIKISAEYMHKDNTSIKTYSFTFIKLNAEPILIAKQKRNMFTASDWLHPLPVLQTKIFLKINTKPKLIIASRWPNIDM